MCSIDCVSSFFRFFLFLFLSYILPFLLSRVFIEFIGVLYSFYVYIVIWAELPEINLMMMIVGG